MSTIRTNTLSNVAGTQSTAIENAINGSAKAWVNFNGTGTVAIRASYNVSSITDNGQGDYTVNFTNAFSDTSYLAVPSCPQASVAGDGSIACFGILATGNIGNDPTLKSTTQCRFVLRYLFTGGTGVFDATQLTVAFFR